MDTGAIKVANVGGIAVKLHWSWLVIFILLVFQFSTAVLPRLLPQANPTVYWVLSVVGVVLFFLSVLLHELAHSFTAQALGLKVRDIVLFIFGGVSNIEGEPKKARDEFLIAVVGPLTSFLLAIFFFVVSLALPPAMQRAGGTLLRYLALLNFALGLFNIIPGFPLDGGRVLRSIIWGLNRDFQTATRIAGFIGQIVAFGFMAWGLYEALFLGNLGGLWIAFIGWFLLNAAQASVTSVVMREALRGITVSQVMQPAPPAVLPHMTLYNLLTQYVLPYNVRAVPVINEQGQVTGIITLTDIKDVPQERWGLVTVEQVMTGPDRLKVVRPYDGLDRAMELLSEGDFDQLPVVDNAGRLVGMLNRGHMLRWLQIRQELKLGPVAKA
jgi:Zn-dependent protease